MNKKTNEINLNLKLLLKNRTKGIKKIVIDIKLNESIIADRILSRSTIEHRDDDREQVIKTRIHKYQSETKPLSNYYRTKYPKSFKAVDGDQEIEKINQDIIKLLKNE